MNMTRMHCALPGALLACAIALPARAASVEAAVNEALARSGHADVLVSLTYVATLERAPLISDKVARRQYVYDTLTAHAAAAQAALRAFLDGRGVTYESFWIDNSLHIRRADAELVGALAARGDVALVRANRAIPLDLPVAETVDRAPAAVEPNIQRIRADVVWAQGDTGQGVVIASIDTGVRWTHEALINQYRGNDGNGRIDHDYSWWDPQHSLSEPADSVSHGTHLVGIAVGGDGPGPFANDIGVAPGARWIAARGCEGFSCSEASLISAGQWVACPTRVDGSDPDCSKAPDVVDNGWGGGGSGDSWYLPVVDAWRAAGIVPVFSVGSSGPTCGSVSSPADYPNVIGVGATDSDDVIASFTSRGPGTFRPLKPDVVAPGESIRSASATSDTAYVFFSGTSMAMSHVTGTAALAIAAEPAAGYAQVYRALGFGAERELGPANTCGGRPSDEFPNFVYGWGRIDAVGAVAIIKR
jgi:subtilisin family serine protease